MFFFFRRIKNLWQLSRFVINEFDNKLVITEKEGQLLVAKTEKKEKTENKKGSIYLPKSDLDEAREALIAKNMARGRDTLLSELS